MPTYPHDDFSGVSLDSPLEKTLLLNIASRLPVDYDSPEILHNSNLKEVSDSLKFLKGTRGDMISVIKQFQDNKSSIREDLTLFLQNSLLVELTVAGWTYSPQASYSEKTSPWIRPFNELSEEMQDTYRQLVKPYSDIFSDSTLITINGREHVITGSNGKYNLFNEAGFPVFVKSYPSIEPDGKFQNYLFAGAPDGEYEILDIRTGEILPWRATSREYVNIDGKDYLPVVSSMIDHPGMNLMDDKGKFFYSENIDRIEAFTPKLPITIQIKHRFFGNVLFEYEKENNTIKDTVEEAVKQRVNLYGANLYGAYLYGAYLEGANLEGANLYGANLKGANLNFASFKGADLREANFAGANLYKTDFEGARSEGAQFKGSDTQESNLHFKSIDENEDKPNFENPEEKPYRLPLIENVSADKTHVKGETYSKDGVSLNEEQSEFLRVLGCIGEPVIIDGEEYSVGVREDGEMVMEKCQDIQEKLSAMLRNEGTMSIMTAEGDEYEVTSKMVTDLARGQIVTAETSIKIFYNSATKRIEPVRNYTKCIDREIQSSPEYKAFKEKQNSRRESVSQQKEENRAFKR